MSDLQHTVVTPMSFRLEYRRGNTAPTMFQRQVIYPSSIYLSIYLFISIYHISIHCHPLFMTATKEKQPPSRFPIPHWIEGILPSTPSTSYPVLKTPAPPIHSSETQLPRPYRSILTQLSSAFCSRLKSSRFEIEKFPSPICPTCRLDEQPPITSSLALLSQLHSPPLTSGRRPLSSIPPWL